MGSVVTFPVYFSLIRSIGPGRAAYSNVVVPVVAMALSTLFEGYHWTMLAWSGRSDAERGVDCAFRAEG
jgi:drug/metabolite transporter (DMT)-like permease